MENERKLMQFYFLTNAEISNHYHQNPEIFYILRGELEVTIDDQKFRLREGDIMMINSSKRHRVNGNERFLGARFEIDLHLLSEYMGSMQLLFWCNTVADKNEAYGKLRELLDKILSRYFEKDEQGALYLNALYYETVYVLTSNFLIRTDDARLSLVDSRDRLRVGQIQNYIQANYQSQISLNDLAKRLYLSNAYLSKYIKKHLGMTFIEYLNNIRLFHAVDELLYTMKNITRIALDNGFPTSAAFTRSFRGVYGEAPSEYRKKMQRQYAQGTGRRELTEDEQERIRQYLDYKEHRNNLDAETEEIIRTSALTKGTLLAKKSRALCAGAAYSILQSDVQRQLKDIQNAAGVQYVRIWDIFPREKCCNEKTGCNFRKIDLVLDFLLENHMKPYLDLGPKLTVFMYSPDRYLKEIHEAKRYEFPVFQQIIKEFGTHLVNRYGIDEIETWYFEYWDDSGSVAEVKLEAEEYFRYFEALSRTLKEISPRIQVGGAGFILGYETLKCREIFRQWRKREIWPDFLSVYSYQYIGVEEGGELYGRKSIDMDYMKNQIAIFRELLKEVDFPVEQLHISEWNFTISNRNVINDSCEQGAYVLKNCIDMNGQVDVMAYWHALDSYSDYYDADMPLNGDSGMISRDGIRKPSFYAYEFMNRLLPDVLYRDGHCIITSNGRDRYTIACHNFKKLYSRYVFTEEDNITVSELDNYMDDSEPLKLHFQITDVKNGDYLLKIHYVNKEKGSAQDIWKRLEFRKNLARDERVYMEKSAIPWMEMQNIHVENGVLDLENVLLEQEIRLIEIQYRYTV